MKHQQTPTARVDLLMLIIALRRKILYKTTLYLYKQPHLFAERREASFASCDPTARSGIFLFRTSVLHS